MTLRNEVAPARDEAEHRLTRDPAPLGNRASAFAALIGAHVVELQHGGRVGRALQGASPALRRPFAAFGCIAHAVIVENRRENVKRLLTTLCHRRIIHRMATNTNAKPESRLARALRLQGEVKERNQLRIAAFIAAKKAT